VVELITTDNACWGAWVITEAGETVKISAKSTILATGGGAGIFKDHLVTDDQIGDGYALAHRAGAEMNNMEFIQFMLGLKSGDTRLFLPLADLRASGMLQDSEGRDLLDLCIPDPKARARTVNDREKHFPFSCRDISHLVDIAVARELKEGKSVFWKKKEQGNGDSAEVVHFCHAFNGGVRINEMAESTIPGLFAAGETAAGPHGADRIGGCMMTATQVFGERAGRFSAIRAKGIRALPETKESCTTFQKQKRTKGDKVLLDKIKAVAKETYHENLMILRDEKGLVRCLEKIRNLELELDDAEWQNVRELQAYSEVKTMLAVGKLIGKNALKRKEGLGSHFRHDVIVHQRKKI